MDDLAKTVAGEAAMKPMQAESRANDRSIQWIQEKQAQILAVEAGSREAVIPLGVLVRALGNISKRNEAEQGVYAKAQTALTHFPGFEDILTEPIRKISDIELNANPRAADLEQFGFLDRWVFFQILENLPSPNSIRAMGDYLSDERDPWKNKHLGEAGRPLPNAYFALESLAKAGLKDPPTKGRPDYEKDLRTWQLWYEQLKAGKRTFSFVGDDRVYNLSGPVTVGMQPNASHAPGTRSMQIETSSPKTGEGAGSPSYLWVALLLVAGLVMGAGMKLWSRKEG